MTQDRFLPVDLGGRRVVVTAGAAGIGRAIAEGFLAAGARVHVCDMDPAAVATVTRELPALSASRTDVARPAEIDAMFDQVEAAFGGVDILINNAGIAGPVGSVVDVTPEGLRDTLAVDVESMFHCVRRAVPLMRAAGGGHVINLASVAGRLSYANRTPYAAAKWGVVGFTRSLALEVGRDGIRVNALLPGHVNTPRFHAVWARRAAAEGISPQEMERRVLGAVALGTTVETADIANMALYLCSPFGAAVTGQAISICGGVEMML